MTQKRLQDLLDEGRMLRRSLEVMSGEAEPGPKRRVRPVMGKAGRRKNEVKD